MLQQTQVERVVPFYTRFLERFPDAETLAAAPLGEVLSMWQGLGYNRRARLLQQCALSVVSHHGGTFPRTRAGLEALPGIGPYTAGALMAFAYNEEVVMIETNIRTVFIHHFFHTRTGDVTDKELLPLIVRMQDTTHPRAWYSALMDYGTHLKKTVGNVSRKSAHHTPQQPFKGSAREVRGAIIRTLTRGPHTRAALVTATGHSAPRIEEQLVKLKNEGMVVYRARKYQLP
jgi:A/G-specific adenine glycosylase